MQLTTAPEITTAATDFILGCLTLFLLLRLRALRDAGPQRIAVWSWVFGLLSAVSFYGTAAHAVVMPKDVLDLFWMPLSFMLGMMVAVFVLAVLYEWKGAVVLKKGAWIAVSLGIIFCVALAALSKFIEGYFIIFIAYSGAAMLFSLALCIVIAVRHHDGAQAFIAAGVAGIIIASVLQAMRSIFFTLVWQFDYNSVYHFILMISVIGIYRGITLRALK